MKLKYGYELFELARRIAFVVVFVGFGVFLWRLSIRPYYSLWHSLLWLIGSYAVMIFFSVVRSIPGMGAQPVRVVYVERQWHYI